MYMYEIIICSIECLKYNQICNQLIKIKEKFYKQQDMNQKEHQKQSQQQK